MSDDMLVRLLSGFDRLEHKFEIVQNSMVEMRSEFVGQRTDFTVMRGDIAGLRADVTVMQGEIAGLRADVTVMQGEIAGLRADVTGLQGDIINIRGDIAGIRGDITGLRAAATSIRAAVTSIRADVTSLRSEVAELRSDIRRHEDALSRLEMGQDELRTGFKRLERDQASLRAELSIRSDRVLDAVTAIRDDITVNYARTDQIGRVVDGVRIEMRSSHQTVLAHLAQLHLQNDSVVNEMQGMNSLVSKIEHQTLRMQSTVAALRRDGEPGASTAPH